MDNPRPWMWTADYPTLCAALGGGEPGSQVAEAAKNTLQARLALEQIAAARRTAWATWILVVVTASLAIVSMVVALTN